MNSDQLAASEPKQEVLPTGPDPGELEERAALAEERAEAAERRADGMQSELEELKAQMAALMRAQRSAEALRKADAETAYDPLPGEEPVFDESEPHGVVMGDPEVGYVQHGHQFARNKTYIRTEKHRGTPRAFNPRLIGFTKPRPGQTAVDTLEGFRGKM